MKEKVSKKETLIFFCKIRENYVKIKFNVFSSKDSGYDYIRLYNSFSYC